MENFGHLRLGNDYPIKFLFQYPEQIMLKYPKVGTENPTIQLKVWNLFENKAKAVTPPAEVLEFAEHIYTAVTWISEETLSVIWVNRVQNESSVSSCIEKSDSWECISVTNPKQAQYIY